MVRLLPVLVILALLHQTSFAREEMNGFHAGQFGDFTQNWKLVTVRYRKDTGEMRFTYANDLAWNALKKNQKRFPEGAVFTKLAVMTKEDPAFPSSATPSGARRTQFMVKNSQKFAGTDGWGYALFDDQGKVIPEDIKAASMACAACHKLVPERDYVFSQPVKLSSFRGPVDSGWGEKIKFVLQETKLMPRALQALLPAGTKEVAVLQGEIAKNTFSGTLDEIRPLLAQETAAQGIPHALISEDGRQFSVVMADKKGGRDCSRIALAGFHTVPNKPLFEIHFCWDYPFRLMEDVKPEGGKLSWEQKSLKAGEVETFAKDRMEALDRLLSPDADPYKGEASMPKHCRPDQLPKLIVQKEAGSRSWLRSFYSSSDFALGLCTDTSRLVKTQYQLLYCEKSAQLYVIKYFYGKDSEWRKEPAASCM